MELFQNRYRVESVRLKGYDYTQPGAYFITIVTHDRECLFGHIADAQMVLNLFGEMVKTEWLRTTDIRPNILVDEFVVMPDHIHGILIITDGNPQPQSIEQFGKPTHNSIPTIVRLFKSTVTKQINQLRQSPGIPIWQRNYYEHIIRNDDELHRIRDYIRNNPRNWRES